MTLHQDHLTRRAVQTRCPFAGAKLLVLGDTQGLADGIFRLCLPGSDWAAYWTLCRLWPHVLEQCNICPEAVPACHALSSRTARAGMDSASTCIAVHLAQLRRVEAQLSAVERAAAIVALGTATGVYLCSSATDGRRSRLKFEKSKKVARLNHAEAVHLSTDKAEASVGGQRG